MQPIVLVDGNFFAEKDRHSYTFKSKKTTCYWPMGGQGLGSCGAWNFLWRVGFHPRQCTVNKLPTPSNNQVLFVDRHKPVTEEIKKTLMRWLHTGGKIIATGSHMAWQDFFPTHLTLQESTLDNPYAGLAYLFGSYMPQLMAPARWPFIVCLKGQMKSFCYGNLASVSGERQSPSRAILDSLSTAPAFLENKGFYYLNANPFAALQAWLQGQEDLSIWYGWRNRLFWLDEWISFFYDLLLSLKVFDDRAERPGIRNMSKSTIILQHDLDYSRDLTLLAEENKKQKSGTFAFLKDNNTHFWINHLKKFPHHEIAFHYDTGKRAWGQTLQRLLFRKNRMPFVPDSKKIAGKGLLKQVKWALKQNPVETLHRHLYYLIYPEWIDAIDEVYETLPNILGSSSLFRGHVLKWGTDRIEGHHGFLSDWPDAQFPLWYPFKIAHAGKGGKIVKGWEMTALMDTEPALVSQMLTHRIKHLQQSVFTFIYHPAHINQSTLYQGGSLKYFQKLLNMTRDHHIPVMTMRDVFKAANHSWEQSA